MWPCPFSSSHNPTPPQVVDVIGSIFTSIFEGLNANYQNEIETIAKQYPVEPFKWLNPPLRLEYPEAVQMLKDVRMNDPNR